MSLLAAGASILGGLLGRSKTKPISAGDNAYSHVEGIMRAAKAFGWSPLTLMGSVSPVGGTPGTTDNSAFGQGIANAGMILSDRMSAKQTQKAKLEKINQTQTRLQNRLDAITIRTPRPGVYGRARIPADPEVYGNGTPSEDHPLASELGNIAVPDPTLDRANPGFLAGFKWEASPGWSPGQHWEDRYGDTPMNWPIAVAQMASDIGYNLRKGQNIAVGRALGAGPVMTMTAPDGTRGEFVMERFRTPERKRLDRLSENWIAATRKARPKRRDMFGTLGFQ